MTRKNAFYAQSGGVSAVINASACGLLQTARQHSEEIGKVYAGRNGIIGALTEDLIDTSVESEAAIAALKHTPGAAFGSCRYKLGTIREHRAQYERLIDVFRAHDIGFFFYNGGGDSQDTAYKVSQMGAGLGYPIVCVGIPKTVDNDLPITDCSPGFGSAAKYVAASIREAAFDLAAMSRTSTKVFALEVMGRHAGWATAACALAAEHEDDAPHILLLPEVPFNEERFLAKVEGALQRHGNCVIAVSEGAKGPDGKFLSASA
jgi:ATP-dependent phosphofructokinase / diphosphate-dependent phosphofructokinase